MQETSGRIPGLRLIINYLGFYLYQGMSNAVFP
jgi:hypothetical protein